jgi:hypothetical protein
MTLLLAAGWIVWVAARRLRLGMPSAAAAAAVASLLTPLLVAAGGAVAAAAWRWRLAAGRRARLQAEREAATMLADLVALGLTAGLSLRAAFAAAGPLVGGDIAEEAAALLDAMDRSGVAGALAAADGSLGDLSRVAANAASSGAPLAAAVAAFAATRRHEDHAARVAAARRLPVRLLLPLTLLILPGFVVLAVGPALLQALARLGP